MIKEILINDAFGKEIPPDHSCIMTLDGYESCELQCPYCFQMNNPEWAKNILIKTNILSVLTEKLQHNEGIESNEIFIGNQSDPYMPLEESYQLTRGMLELLCDKNYTIYIVTKSDSRLILRDLDILTKFKKPATIILGLSHIN